MQRDRLPSLPRSSLQPDFKRKHPTGELLGKVEEGDHESGR